LITPTGAQQWLSEDLRFILAGLENQNPENLSHRNRFLFINQIKIDSIIASLD